MDIKNDLKKALHRAIAKAYKKGNTAILKALDGMPDKEHSVKHIMADIEDEDMIAETPKDHIPAAAQNVLHKDQDPMKPMQEQMKAMHEQKQMQAEAKLGTQEKGVQKLRKFMEKCEMKKQEKNPDMEKRCWDGYEPVPGKKPYTKGSCQKK